MLVHVHILTFLLYWIESFIMRIAVVGLQWGDEGKGKVVDFLAKDFAVNARYQGGSNAGHTVRLSDKQVIFHQIPCGILNKNVVGVIGAGCVFDPQVFFDELENLKNIDPHIEKRIKISKFCHLIFPYHILIDKIREEETKQRIGTTKKGIGVAYEDKYARVGMRVGDLFDRELFEKKLRMNISRKNVMLMEIYHAEPLSESEMFNKYMDYAERLKHMVTDDTKFLSEAMHDNKNIIFEGAQGALLDINFGTYPYVTSSHTITSGAGIGLGIPPYSIDDVIGVAKAYTTRVGQGPFPTEDDSEVGQNLRKSGQEFGATTGRPRRCGPFDASIIKYTARINGVKKLFLTKLDVLSKLDTIKIAVRYSNAEEFDPFYAADLEPVYEEIPGFRKDISHIRNFDDLPAEAKTYINLIEQHTGLEISFISVGARREAVITK